MGAIIGFVFIAGEESGLYINGDMLSIDDKTIEIAQKYGCTILINPFVNFAKQRNFALQKFSISSEWTLFLDADEWVTEQLKEEIKNVIASKPVENGFYIKHRST